MRISLFLLLVTLTCIACDSVVARSRGLIQAKTLDENSPRERTDGIRRNLREGMVEADVTDVEERAPVVPELVSTRLKDMAESIKTSYNKLIASLANLRNKVARNPTVDTSIHDSNPVTTSKELKNANEIVKEKKDEKTSKSIIAKASRLIEQAKQKSKDAKQSLANTFNRQGKSGANAEIPAAEGANNAANVVKPKEGSGARKSRFDELKKKVLHGIERMKKQQQTVDPVYHSLPRTEEGNRDAKATITTEGGATRAQNGENTGANSVKVGLQKWLQKKREMASKGYASINKIARDVKLSKLKRNDAGNQGGAVAAETGNVHVQP